MYQKEPNQRKLKGKKLAKKKAAIGIEATDTKSQCQKHLKIVSLPPTHNCLPHTKCMNAMRESEKKNHSQVHNAHKQATAIDQVKKFKFECDQYTHTYTYTPKCTEKIPLFDSKYHHGANCLLILPSDSMF